MFEIGKLYQVITSDVWLYPIPARDLHKGRKKLSLGDVLLVVDWTYVPKRPRDLVGSKMQTAVFLYGEQRYTGMSGLIDYPSIYLKKVSRS